MITNPVLAQLIGNVCAAGAVALVVLSFAVVAVSKWFSPVGD